MIKVYFERKQKYAELVANFDSEETYAVCLPSLEELALNNGFDLVTESVDEERTIYELVD
jgi:hypothetical protein